MPDIMHIIQIDATPERVFQALTTADGIHGWWTRDAVIDAKVGGIGEFGFFDRLFVSKVRIEEFEPPTRVTWKPIANTPGLWDDTLITFDIRPDTNTGGTLVSLVHRGYKQPDEIYGRFTTGWGYYLISLRQYLETGQGGPAPDVDFGRVTRKR
jgi:uncharacterized protein YndB with AHSA1/START domain